MDINNYKSYKFVAQDIYNILYNNQEIFTITGHVYIAGVRLVDWVTRANMKLSVCLVLIIMIVLIIIPPLISIVNLVLNISCYTSKYIYYKYLTD